MADLQDIVVLTFPAHGHINPLLSLAKILIPYGFRFTFAVAANLVQKLRYDLQQEDEETAASESESAASASSSSIRIASLDFSIKESESHFFSIADLLDICNSTRPSFENLLRDLARHGDVCCLISDAFAVWSHHVASELHIPSFSFYTSNAHAFATVVNIHSIISRLASRPDPDEIVDFIPGVEHLLIRELPQSVCEAPFFVIEIFKHLSQASGVILNTVYEIEQKTLEQTKMKCPVYPIGPLMLMLKSTESVSKQLAHAEISEEENICLKWLDSKPTSSVLFVCFGTLAKTAGDQLRELASGLEGSRQPFLWVIRTDMVNESLSSTLPEGFLDRTKDRGLIIKWAPQLQVLSHPAVGGFLTHCGWNSMTENLCLGAVPMICWPQMAEQKINARILVDEWKVGLKLLNDKGVVKREAVEKTVRDIMQGDVGTELKARAIELKKVLFSAVQAGGSSKNYLEALIQDIRKPRQKHSDTTTIKEHA